MKRMQGGGMQGGMGDFAELHALLEKRMVNAPAAPAVMANVACCKCGVMIPPNAMMMCVRCLQSTTDITAGIAKQLVLPHCGDCGRYQKPPWVHAEWESDALMALCLKRIRGLNKVKLQSSQFVWTEPNSRRIKVQCTVTKNLEQGVVQQSFIAEFHVHNSQCEDCKRKWTPHTWNTVVQVRQRTVDQKHTMILLEQLIIKHEAHDRVLNVEEAKDGLDFFFASLNHASKFVEFVQSCFPAKSRSSSQLISHNEKNNTAHQKFALFVEVAPVSRFEIVYLPKQLRATLGGCSPLMLVSKVCAYVHLLDPFSLRSVDVPGLNYWKDQFYAVLQKRHMSQFLVIDVIEVNNLIADAPNTLSDDGQSYKNGVALAGGKSSANALQQAPARGSKKQKDLRKQRKADKELDAAIANNAALNKLGSLGEQIMREARAAAMDQMTVTTISKKTRNVQGQLVTTKLRIADVVVARAGDEANLDSHVTVRTHLGAYLRPGDICEGFDLRILNLAGNVDEAINADELGFPVILVKKLFGDREARARARLWNIQRLPINTDQVNKRSEEEREKAYEDFKAEIEELPDMRRDVNLYRDEEAIARRKNKLKKKAAKAANAEENVEENNEEEEEKEEQREDYFNDDSDDDDVDYSKNELEEFDHAAKMVQLSEMLSGLDLNKYKPQPKATVIQPEEIITDQYDDADQGPAFLY